MIKWLLTGLIVYLLYRYFIATPAIPPAGSSDETRQSTDSQTKRDEEGEYIDYEEVD